MSNSIDRIRIKIQRAKEHVVDLESECRAFFATNPYVVGTKKDPQTRKLIYYVVSVQPVPDRIAAIAGNVLQDLRSALDHLAYALWAVGTGSSFGAPARHVYFPIADDGAKYASESPGKVKGMRQDAVDSINALKPYKGGNDTLWKLHKLNNIDKHRFVIMVGSAFRSIDLGAYALAEMAKFDPRVAGVDIHAFFMTVDKMFPLKAGAELFMDRPDAEMNKKLQFRFEVAFGEPGIIEGEPLLPTLHQMVDLVSSIVADFGPLLT